MDGSTDRTSTPERFTHFGLGELQALVTAFAVAGAYKGAGGFSHPVWRAMADDASAALEAAAREDVANQRQAERDKTCPHGMHFGGHWCEECARERSSEQSANAPVSAATNQTQGSQEGDHGDD